MDSGSWNLRFKKMLKDHWDLRARHAGTAGDNTAGPIKSRLHAVPWRSGYTAQCLGRRPRSLQLRSGLSPNPTQRTLGSRSTLQGTRWWLAEIAAAIVGTTSFCPHSTTLGGFGVGYVVFKNWTWPIGSGKEPIAVQRFSLVNPKDLSHSLSLQNSVKRRSNLLQSLSIPTLAEPRCP